MPDASNPVSIIDEANQNNTFSSCSIDKIKEIVKYFPQIVVNEGIVDPGTVEKLKYICGRLYEAMKTDDISIRLLDLACSNATRGMLRNNPFYHSIGALRSVLLIKSFASDVIDHIKYVPAEGYVSELELMYTEYPSINAYKGSFKTSTGVSCIDMFIIREMYNIYKSGNPYKLSDNSELSVIETNICSDSDSDFYFELTLCDANGNPIDPNETPDSDKDNKKKRPTLPYMIVKSHRSDSNGIPTDEYCLVTYQRVDSELRCYAKYIEVARGMVNSMIMAAIGKPGHAGAIMANCYHHDDNYHTRIELCSMGIRESPIVTVNKEVSGPIIKAVDYIFKKGGHRGYAFIGRPGSGKTSMMSTIIQHFTDIPTLTIGNVYPLSNYYIYGLSDVLRSVGKCIIYIDDMDGYDLQTKNKNVTALIALFEHLNSMKVNYVFVCTANNAKNINSSLIGRADRIDEVIEFSGISIDEIKKTLVKNLGISFIKDECNQGIKDLSEIGATYSDINNISNMVKMYYDGELNKESIDFAISRMKSTKKISMLDDTV